MKEIIDFRLDEALAVKYLDRNIGKRLGDTSVRKVVTEVGSPLYKKIEELYRQLLPDYLFVGWAIRRRYSEREIAEAEAFYMIPPHQWQVNGETCGTEYDYGSACPDCGGGIQRIGPLRMDLRKLDKKNDPVISYAGEFTVSPRFAAKAIEAGITGCEFASIVHAPYVERERFDLSSTPTGKEILRLAREEGVEGNLVGYELFLGKPEIQIMYRKAAAEYSAVHGDSTRLKAARTRATRARPPDPWYELIIISEPVDIASQTYVNEGPFDPYDSTRCISHGGAFGHSIGSRVISELYIRRDSWRGRDMAVTGQLTGHWFGTSRPGPEFVVSPRFRQWAIDNGFKCGFEVARLV